MPNYLMKLKTPPAINKISNVQIVFMATEALWNNKLRTSLTMLGVIIGISSVIAITSVGQGVQKSTEEQLKALGTNVCWFYRVLPDRVVLVRVAVLLVP